MSNNGSAGLIDSAVQSTLGELFKSIAMAYPQRVALMDNGRAITYAELEERSNCLANHLLSQGVEFGDRIAVLSKNRFEYFEVLIAAAKVGAIVAALNWRLREAELAHCIRLVEPRLLITSAELESILDDSLSVTILNGTMRLVFDGNYEACLEVQAATFCPLRLSTEAGLVILYTSGTTGLPKGALISHRAMIARGLVYHLVIEVPDQDNFVAWTPFYHMVSTDHGLATLLRGGTVWCIDGYQPEKLIELVEKVSISWFVLVPGMVGEFNAELRKKKVNPKGLGVIGAMADLIPREEIAEATRLLNTPFLNTFGATETGMGPATGGRIAVGELPESLSKIQTPFCELRLEDEAGNEVAIGMPGEAKVAGPTLFSGYWNNEEENQEAFKGGRFCMGDVLQRNLDGTLDYVDRVKYMIKSGGENIYPAEVELVIAADQRVEAAIVVRKPDNKWGEIPVAFVVRKDPLLDQETIHALCKQQLAGYKTPKEIHFIADEDIPRSTTGKIQRHLLEAMLA